jgi:hypothetical protein
VSPVALRALLGALAVSGTASATAGTYLSDSSRAAALAGSVSARPGDAATMLDNPAGLADVDEPLLMLGVHVARLDQWFARSGEARQERDRTFGAYGAAVATPLPGAVSFLHFGLALDFPTAHLLRVSVPERSDRPSSPIYDGRPERMAAAVGLGAELLPELRLGAGLSLTPTLDTPTEVTYVAGRGNDPEQDVIVRLDRDLHFAAAPFFGLRAVPLPELALGVVYRAASISRASGDSRTVAGGILADDPIGYSQTWNPAELVFGAFVSPLPPLGISLDGTWSRWATARDGFDQRRQIPMQSVWSVRGGVEFRVLPSLTARAGYAYEPTPVPAEVGDENLLGADTHVLALGGGLDLRELVGLPMLVDAHVRGHLGATQRAEKDPEVLGDADSALPGQQIDNLGYPGFESRAWLIQAGLTVTLFVGSGG